MDKGLGPPPKPSRRANGQGLRAPQPFMTWRRPLKWTMDKGWGPPQPFTTCKWTRVAPPPTLHNLQMDKSWGPCNPSRLGNGLQMDKGWGRLPNGQGLGASPTPICKWTRVGLHDSPPPPTLQDLQMDKGWGPSRLANGQRLDKGWGPPNFPPLPALPLDKGWTPSTFRDLGWPPQINFTASTYVSKPTRRLKIDKTMTGPFGPERTPTQTLNFVWTSIGASKPSNA